MVDSGPRLLTPFVMITLSLWVTESVVRVSTPNMCRIHNVEHRSHVAAVHTKQHKGNW